jgi:hypothetical protein
MSVHNGGVRVAQAQEIPLKFVENILGDLRHARHRAQPARCRGPGGDPNAMALSGKPGPV